jgi:hypothetical protein
MTDEELCRAARDAACRSSGLYAKHGLGSPEVAATTRHFLRT